MKADRLMSVLLLLQARGQVTERELAEQLEVSQRTIHRDLEALSAARIPVSAMRGAQGGWQLEKGWRTHVPSLDEAELRALLMAQPRTLGNPRMAAAAQSAMNKLMAAMPEPLKAQAAHMQQRLHVDPTGWRGTGEDVSMLTLVQEAVARDRKLTFEYTKADGEESSRTVDPFGLVSKGLSWYLVARTAKGMRTFRVSRMRKVAVLAVQFERPSRFDLAEHWKAATAELDRKRAGFKTVLSVREDMVRRLEAWCATRAAKGEWARKAGAGRVALEVDFDDEGMARFFVLGMGSAVRVLEPQAMKEWVSRETKAVAEVLLEA
ncbi:MAG: YafY family transcriptional regulator [Acidobacteria bacterium]|nr:YafY family transcriptional regulator [Acidobacteriota bacterium]